MPLKLGLPSAARGARYVRVCPPAAITANVRPRLTVNAQLSQFRIGTISTGRIRSRARVLLRQLDSTTEYLTLPEAARQEDHAGNRRPPWLSSRHDAPTAPRRGGCRRHVRLPCDAGPG